MTQALALWSKILQFAVGPYIVLLDIAKVYPSTPQPLLWETMYTLGVQPAMISTLHHAYEHTRGYFTTQGRKHTCCQKLGVKEGCPLSPLLFHIVYDGFHRTLSRRFPLAKFLEDMDDIAFISPDIETTQPPNAPITHRHCPFPSGLTLL